MKRKFKAVFTIIVLLTAVIPVLAYKQNIDYRRHVQELREEYAKIGIDPDVSPWQAWGMGPLVVFLIVVTIDSCIVSSIIWFQERHKKPRVTPSEACHRLALREGQKENTMEAQKGGEDSETRRRY